MKLSFTTIVRNELGNLKELLPVLVRHVDEIVIVDTGSDDGTVEYLERGGATVIHTTMDKGYAEARNKGLRQCTGSWVFSLDADERPSVGVMDWLKGNLHRRVAALVFRRVTTIDGNQIADERMVRAFRRDTGEWVGEIHESVVVTGRKHKCPKDLFIRHDKTHAQQAQRNRQYLDFYSKFNLGSGGNPMPVGEGWINYDVDPKHAPDSEYADVFEELPSIMPASHILASHILEHVSYHKTNLVLAMWIDKLAPGGTIEIRVPDAGAVMRDYVAKSIDYLRLIQLLYGGQTTEWDYHNIAIDEGWLTGQFYWNGLEMVRKLPGTQDHELIMVARKPL